MVKPKLVPATGDALLARTSLVALAALIATLTVVESALALSAAVIVCVPALTSVAENVPWPLVSVESGGSTAPVAVSLPVRRTGPAQPGATVPSGFLAVTATGEGWPALPV